MLRGFLVNNNIGNEIESLHFNLSNLLYQIYSSNDNYNDHIINYSYAIGLLNLKLKLWKYKASFQEMAPLRASCELTQAAVQAQSAAAEAGTAGTAGTGITSTSRS